MERRRSVHTVLFLAGMPRGGEEGHPLSFAGSIVLLCFEGSAQLAFLQFKLPAASLDAQLLTLTLRELARPPTAASGGDAVAPVIDSCAWDPQSKRLAISLGKGHGFPGLVAVYETECRPTLTAYFLGYCRCPTSHPGGDEEPEEGSGQGPRGLVFHPAFPGGPGALLSVLSPGGLVHSVPFYWD